MKAAPAETRKIMGVEREETPHWVGDGFPVRTLISYDRSPELFSPFLLLDYAGPAEFAPSDTPRGVGPHPHRGFETVTIVYQGEVEHRDSAGHAGRIGPDDVQWMTAARGVVHEEMHGRDFTKKGGTLEMVQLWVNLPAAKKMTPPAYQDLLDAKIPAVTLPAKAGTVRVIAGTFDGVRGPARTFTPVHVWDARLRAGARAELPFAAGHNASMLVLRGDVVAKGSRSARPGELVVFDRTGGGVSVEAKSDATLLILSGEPIAEPVAGYGPFVMNTKAELRQAVLDYQSGAMGRLA